MSKFDPNHLNVLIATVIKNNPIPETEEKVESSNYEN